MNDEDILTQKESKALGNFINLLHDDTCNSLKLKMNGESCVGNSQKFNEAREECTAAGLTERYLIMADFFTRCATIEKMNVIDKDNSHENEASFIVQIVSNIYESKIEENKKVGVSDEWIEKCYEYSKNDIREKEDEIKNLLTDSTDSIKDKKMNDLSKEDLLKQCELLSIPITRKQKNEIETFFEQHSAKSEENSIER